MQRLFLLFVLILPATSSLADDPASADGAAETHVVMYKSPTCGCCEKWADHLRAHGFTVDSRPTDLMESIKDERGVPVNLRSCHTAEVAGYVVEGHVPADDILRLLRERPDNLRVLTVPGMPLGSPGMEHPRPQDFITIAVQDDGKAAIYAEHAAGEDFSPADR
ncbi:MAG: DUF411 domain-containing protein [Gammaproteobacteria bacterium]|nr:DUF411 domain-containing protein [Gammaproteobacteria bacterium]MDH5308881.1 DUF411 domain-containing protein [Gammaproteobacteria bacterium]